VALLDRLTIVALPPGFQPGGFDCEEPEVVAYICDGSAARDEATGVTRTHLIKDGDDLVGYISICCDFIKLDKEEREAEGLEDRNRGAPALKVGYMGRQRKYARQNVGEWMLKWVVGIARNIGAVAGIRFITLDSLPRPGLVEWYEEYGFVKNIGEDKARRIIVKWGSGKKNKPLEEFDMPHISMRYDIRKEREVVGASTAAQ
jgi:GNAT superfamily N-acetyltransferase